MSRIALSRTLVNQILRHVQTSPEEEVCGLIGSPAAGEMHLYPIPNVARDTQHLFTMDPKGQIDAMRTMREANETLFAIYHSHPHGPATPSALDMQLAAYPDVLYLIVSLDTKGVLDLRCYKLREREMQSVELELLEGS